MKVYQDEGGEKRLIGRADVPQDTGPIYEVLLFGSAPTIADIFAIGTMTHLLPVGTAPAVERVVLLASGQRPDVLPGWQPLAS